MNKSSLRNQITGTLCFPLLASLILNIFTYFYAFPRSDSLELLEYFHTYYSHFYFHGDLMQWLPWHYGGLQNYYFSVWGLSPFSYFSMLVGKILFVKSSYLLFYFSIFCEIFVYLFGLNLLTRKIGYSNFSRLFVGLVAALTVVWEYQIAFNFRFYAFVPLCIYWVARFLEQGDFRFLLLSMFVGLLTLLGTPVYIAPIYLLVFGVIGVVFVFKSEKRINIRWSSLVNSQSLVLIVLCGLIAFCIGYICFNTFSDSFSWLFLRGTSDGKVSLSTFQRYSYLPPAKYLEFLFGYPGFDRGIMVFIGIPALVFSLMSLLIKKNALQLALWCMIGFLIVFGLGSLTPVSEFLYFNFPFMDRYRHISSVIVLVKLGLIICSGAGVEHLIRSERKDKLFLFCSIAVMALFGLICLKYDFIAPYEVPRHLPSVGKLFPLGVTSIVSLSVLVIIYCFFWRQKNIVQSSILLITALGLMLYQYLLFTEFPTQDQNNLASEFKVKQHEYSWERNSYRNTHPKGQLVDMIIRHASVNGIWALSAVDIDTCDLKRIRLNYLSNGLGELYYPVLKQYGTNWLAKIIAKNRRISPDFDILMSCGESKLWLSESEKSLPANARNVSKDFISVSRFSANELELSVEVKGNDSRWLNYSDSFHPNWKAWVNGVENDITLSLGAFKAVLLRPGLNQVRFEFGGGIYQAVLTLMAVVSIIFSFVFLWVAVRALFQEESLPPLERRE